MDMNLQKYMAFVKTVENGSFTRAAQLLNYSRSGISRMINDLEKEWKVVLLERDRSGARLTSDGMKLLPYARELCREYEKLQRKVDELNGLQAGFIRIGTFSSVATHWLPGIIKEFQKAYPNIEYELLLGDYREIEEWILEGRVDCGFLRLPAHPDLETHFLEEDRFLAILPELLLRRIPYRIAARELDVKAVRRIGIALKNSKSAPLAVKRFLDYLKYRQILTDRPFYGKM